MAWRWPKFVGATVLALLTVPLVSAVGMAEDRALRQLEKAIARVRKAETRDARDNAAERLPELTKSLPPDQIDNKTLSDLVSLLDTWDDAVRVPVAMSLGNIGPRAKIAGPKLIQMLPEVECQPVDVPPAPIIRDALQRMGETPPPARTCEIKVDPALWKQRLRDTIVKVQNSDSSMDRAKAAVHLDYLTSVMDPKTVDDKAILNLMTLLDIDEEPVRAEVAATLGNLGPRARVAIPKLEELFSKESCRSDQWPAKNIQYALERMGVKPPTRPVCAKPTP